MYQVDDAILTLKFEKAKWFEVEKSLIFELIRRDSLNVSNHLNRKGWLIQGLVQKLRYALFDHPHLHCSLTEFLISYVFANHQPTSIAGVT